MKLYFTVVGQAQGRLVTGLEKYEVQIRAHDLWNSQISQNGRRPLYSFRHPDWFDGMVVAALYK